MLLSVLSCDVILDVNYHKNFNFRDYFKLSDKVYLYYYFLVILIFSVKESHDM